MFFKGLKLLSFHSSKPKMIILTNNNLFLWHFSKHRVEKHFAVQIKTHIIHYTHAHTHMDGFKLWLKMTFSANSK